MVIYSTTRDKPVLGEMRERDFVKCWQKGIVYIEGDRKTPNIACQWNTHLKPPAQTPIFFGSRPPLDIFWRVVYNYFSTLFILAFGRSYDVMKILKYIIMLLRKIEKTLRKFSQWKSWKSALEASGRLHLPLPKYERTPCDILIFLLSTKPSFLRKCE